MPFSHEEVLQLVSLSVKKWAELTCKEIDKDLTALGSLDVFDQAYKRAFWWQYLEIMSNIPHTQTTDDEEKWKLILEMFGDQLDLPSNSVKVDVKSRLDWLKRRLAKDFELEFTRLINEKAISSPVEQIFLMEWKFAGIDKKLKVHLSPHEPVTTDDGSYNVDFLIIPEDPSLERIKIAIELDGHEFHEKSKSQVRKDKARERAIVRQGVTVLRFSASEVVRNARGCVEEVEQFLKAKVHV